MRLTSAFAAVFCLASVASALPVGIGGDFDVIVRNNFTVNGAHVHGSTAVGGSLVLKGNMSEFGNQQPTGTGPNVVVNGQIVMDASARVNRDGIVHVGSLGGGQSVNSSQDIVGGGKSFYANQTIVGPTGLDIDSAFDTFIAYSDFLAGLSPTMDASVFSSGSVPNKRFNLTFDLGTPFEVISLTGNELKQFSEVKVAGAGSSPTGLIINVDLSDYTGGAFVQNRNADGGGSGADWVLWNFYGASSVTIDRQFVGTIFAPEMEVILGNDQFLGAIIADTLVKNGSQIHRHRYAGDVPPHSVPDGGMTAAMVLVGMGALVAIRRWAK